MATVPKPKPKVTNAADVKTPLPEAGGTHAPKPGNGNGNGNGKPKGKSLPLPNLKTPNTSKEHNIVVFAMFGTAGVLIIADIHKGSFPSARQLIGLGFVFAALAALTVFAPGIAAPFALLVFVGVLLNKGLGFFSGIGIASSSPTPLQGPVDASGAVMGKAGDSSYTPIGGYVNQEASPKANRAAMFARAAIGTPYVYGGTTPNGYDCSGLCMAAYAAAGVTIPRTSEEQYAAGFQVVQWGEWAPGDLIFSQWPGDDAAPGHVVMYYGGGQCVAAPHTGATVEFEPVSTFASPHYWGSVRPAPMAVTKRDKQIGRHK